MAKVQVDVTGKDSGAKPVLDAAARAAENLNNAIARLIQEEKQAAAMKEAEAKFKAMSAAQKDAALSAYELAGAQKKAREEAESKKIKLDSFTDLKSAIDLTTGAADVAVQAIQKIFEVGKQGAAVQQTADSFDYLIQKVGAAPDLLDQLVAASKRTVDEQKLMSSTSVLLAGAQGQLATSLANSTPQLLEIAKAAQKLNPTLGDTTFLYESLALGIKRGSPMILDNLGLTIKIGEANEKFAASLGKTVEELTADEQKQALLNATLEAGKVLIEQAGGTTDSAADSIARMEAAGKDLGDTLSVKVAPAIAQVAEGLTLLIAGNQEGADELAKTGNQAAQNAKTYEEYKQQIKDAAEADGFWVDEQGRLRDMHLNVIDATYGLTEAQYNQMQASRRAAQATSEQADAEEDWKKSINDSRREAERMNMQLAAMDGQIHSSVLGTWDAIQASDGYKDALGRVTAAQQALADAQASFNESFGDKVVGKLEAAGISGDKLAQAYGLLDDKLGTNYVAQDKANKALDDAIRKFQQTGDVDAFSAALEENKSAWEVMDEGIQKTRESLQNATTDWNNFLTRIAEANGLHVTIYADVVHSGGGGSRGSGPSGGGGSDRAGADEDIAESRFASGGQFVIPPGYTETWPVGPNHTASSGETVTITPRGQTPPGNGGGTNITIENLILNGVQNPRQLLAQLGAITKNNGATAYAGGG
jgi:hypothetical protein